MYHQTSMCTGPQVPPCHLLSQEGREKTTFWHSQRHCEAHGLAHRVNQKVVNSCEFATCTPLALGHKMGLDLDSRQSPDLSLRSNFDPSTDRVLTLDAHPTLTPAQIWPRPHFHHYLPNPSHHHPDSGIELRMTSQFTFHWATTVIV